MNAYTHTKVTTTGNPVDLVIMLYDGAIEFLDKSAAAINMKETQIKIRYIDKTLAIIEELFNSINFEAGGQIAINLAGLYQYMMKELVLANIKNDADKIKHVSNLLKELRDAWIHIKNQV